MLAVEVVVEVNSLLICCVNESRDLELVIPVNDP